MLSTAPCPSLEDLAAFLDGGDELSTERRREIVEHLAACEECYEVFAGAAACLDDASEVAAPGTEEPSPLPGIVRPFERPPRPVSRGVVTGIAAAIAALLLVTLGVVYLLRRDAASRMTSADLVAAIGPPTGSVPPIAFPWGLRLRGEGEDNQTLIAPELESFQLGVRELDLRQALATGDAAAAAMALSRLHQFLGEMEFLPDKTRGEYDALGQALTEIVNQATVTGTSGASGTSEARLDLRPLLPQADKLESSGFTGVIDADLADFVALGRWTEACRLSAAVGHGRIFTKSETRRLLDSFFAPQVARDGVKPPAGAVRADLLGAADARQILDDLRQRIAQLPAGAPAAAVKPLAEPCEHLLRELDPG
jgi:Putative zinc-finger